MAVAQNLKAGAMQAVVSGSTYRVLPCKHLAVRQKHVSKMGTLVNGNMDYTLWSHGG